MPGPITSNTPIRFQDTLPEHADVLIIGGGAIGICSALYLAEEGFSVVVVEKGRIAGEQSSRNWGWIRQLGRDSAELPVMMEASRLWQELDERVGGATGFKREGILYLASSKAELERSAEWLEIARNHQLDARLLTKSEVSAMIEQRAGGHRWFGASYLPSDARAEPWQAVPALADLARAGGVGMRENCAARALEFSGGRLAGVWTEAGRVKCDQVVVAGGAWSSLFLDRHDIFLPQLNVKSTVGRTAPMPDVFAGCAADEAFGFRRREDGGYTVAAFDRHDHYIGPGSFRGLLHWLPMARRNIRDTVFRLAAPSGFPEAWGTKRRWAADEETPFERMRVLDPAPSADRKVLIEQRFAERFPGLGKPVIRDLWAGMIDAMPDVVPVVDRVPGCEGVIVATGMSGHGFGIAPGFGRIVAQLAAGKPAGHDIARFRFSRFSDGSRLESGPAL